MLFSLHHACLTQLLLWHKFDGRAGRMYINYIAGLHKKMFTSFTCHWTHVFDHEITSAYYEEKKIQGHYYFMQILNQF